MLPESYQSKQFQAYETASGSTDMAFVWTFCFLFL